jgi:hypothetical protein
VLLVLLEVHVKQQKSGVGKQIVSQSYRMLLCYLYLHKRKRKTIHSGNWCELQFPQYFGIITYYIVIHGGWFMFLLAGETRITGNEGNVVAVNTCFCSGGGWV